MILWHTDGKGSRVTINQRRPRPVHALIDWNSELHAQRTSSGGDDTAIARIALKRTCRDIGKLLAIKAPDTVFSLHLRAYHGWRRGFEPTPRRRALEEASRAFSPNDPSDPGLSAYTTRPTIVVQSLAFGDRLLGASDARLCGQALDHHLPSTLQHDRAGQPGEKMVDTALVADLICLALEEDGSWLIVLGQDADLVPGILAAEGLLKGSDRRVIFFARGGISSSNPKIGDLVCRR